MAPHADQPGQQVAILGQFHLQAAFLGLGPLGENVQDQAAAVQHLDSQQLRQHSLLGGGQVIIENHHVRPGIFAVELDLRHLALTDEGAGVRRWPVLQNDAHGLTPGSFHQVGQLLHALFRGAVLLEDRGIQPHQHHVVSNFFSR